MAQADLAGRVIESSSRTDWGARPHWIEGALLGLGVAEFAALSLFVATAAVASFCHEPWSDEAQAWLIARDLSIPRIFAIMTYEGSPPLWHLLLKALIWLHLPYGALGAVSVTLMSGAMYVWLRWSPLPLLLRLVVPFAFYFQYQYAVVARTYALSTLLAFVAAALFRAKPPRILPLAITLALLAQTNLYGFVMAAGLAIAFVVEYRQEIWNRRVPSLQVAVGTFVVTASLFAAKLLASPPIDSSSGGGRSLSSGAKLVNIQASVVSGIETLYKSLGMNNTWKILALILVVVWTVALRRRFYALPILFTGLSIYGADLLRRYLVIGLLLLLLMWFVSVRKFHCSLPLLLTLLVMGLIWAINHHFGMALTALLVSLWIAWPESSSSETRFWTKFLQTSLAIVIILQIPQTFAAVRNEIKEPYSGAAAAAEYLRPFVGKRPIYGAYFFPVALQPYFAENIFVNQTSAFWVFSKTYEERVRQVLSTGLPVDAVVVLPTAINDIGQQYLNPLSIPLGRQQLQRTHTFCGRLFWFGTQSGFNCFDIYEKQR